MGKIEFYIIEMTPGSLSISEKTSYHKISQSVSNLWVWFYNTH